MHNVPPDSESHFKLVIVSDDFIDMSKVKQTSSYILCIKRDYEKNSCLSIQAFTIG